MQTLIKANISQRTFEQHIPLESLDTRKTEPFETDDYGTITAQNNNKTIS
jgi:hypothetical protein